MSCRTKIGSRVSTKAWRFDTASGKSIHRWSYKIFGEKWMDCHVIGTVGGKQGSKWTVIWDIDGEETAFNNEYLQKENDTIPTQIYVKWTANSDKVHDPTIDVSGFEVMNSTASGVIVSHIQELNVGDSQVVNKTPIVDIVSDSGDLAVSISQVVNSTPINDSGDPTIDVVNVNGKKSCDIASDW